MIESTCKRIPNVLTLLLGSQSIDLLTFVNVLGATTALFSSWTRTIQSIKVAFANVFYPAVDGPLTSYIAFSID